MWLPGAVTIVTLAKVLATVGAVAGQAAGHALVGAGDRVERVVAARGVALRARRAGRDVVGGLARPRSALSAKRGRRGVAAVAVTAGRVALSKRVGPRVAGRWWRCSRASPGKARALVAGLAGRHRCCHRACGRQRQRRDVDARGAELEAARVDVRGGMAARAVAVEAADRDVVARGRNDRDVGEGGRDRRRVAAQAVGHALVRAGDRVQRRSCPPWCGTARTARGRDVVGGLGCRRQQVGGEGRRGACGSSSQSPVVG